MPLLTLDGGCLAFGHVALLDHAQFQVDQGERLALIGRNGTGKSSLLKALVGISALDDGVLWQQPSLTVAYVAQESDFTGDLSVFDAVAGGLGEVSTLLHDYHAATLEVGAGETAAMDRMHELQTQLDAQNGWNLNSRVEQVLSRIDLSAETPVSQLSGGGKKRVALARALVASPDLLLLDEPTNHLDVDGIIWLEGLLRDYPGAVMLITHDRSFLDNVATRVLELDRGQLTSFPGSFAAYQEKKEAMLHAEGLANARADKLLAQEEVWIRKGVEARRTRSVGRIKRLEQLRGERSARREQLGKVDFRLVRGDESGKMVSELDGVSKTFGDKPVVRDFSCRILRGDKIGLIGPNGSGKTTLLRLILGTLEPDSGTVRQGARIEVAYFDQFRTALDPEATLADVISPGSEYVEIAGARQHVIGYLGDFLFAPARARSPVKSLSGGERARLLLARLFARPANVLVLDEPTNDLDIETLELLETLIQEYPGTVFLVSHDRAFLDNVVTQTIASEGDGHWKEYAGGYADWLRQRPAPFAGSAASSKGDVREAKDDVQAALPKARSNIVKLSFKEQKELDGLPARIETLEQEQVALQALLADPDYYKRPADQVRTHQQRLDGLEKEIVSAMERWELLEAKISA